MLETNEQREADTGQQHRPNNPWVAKISVLGHPAEQIGLRGNIIDQITIKTKTQKVVFS